MGLGPGFVHFLFEISRYSSTLSQTFGFIHFMVSDFFSCVIVA